MTSIDSAAAIGLPAASPPPSHSSRAKLPPTPAALRRRLERAVDRIISALDALDATDEDFEDGGDAEPSLAFLERHPSCAGPWSAERDGSGDQADTRHGGHSDLEEEHDGREPDDDAEDSLAGIETSPSPTRCHAMRRSTDGDQRSWSCGASGDLESDNDCDLEDGHDAEFVNEDGGQLGTAPDEGYTEVTALVHQPDGSETILRHIADSLKGVQAVHAAMERGADVRGIMFKQVRH